MTRGATSFLFFRSFSANAILAIAALWLVFGAGEDVAAKEAVQPLAYQATVTNGRVTGSGFLVTQDLAITNAHVLNGRRPGEYVTLRVPQGSGRSIPARIVSVSSRIDLAVLQVANASLPVAPFTSGRISRGATVFAAGVVARNGPSDRRAYRGSVVSGTKVIPPFGRGVIARIPGVALGFSGGPVLDDRGRLVGMIAAIRPEAGGSGKEAFIISAAEIRKEISRIKGFQMANRDRDRTTVTVSTSGPLAQRR
jgi:S1-C subfamily serine protease